MRISITTAALTLVFAHTQATAIPSITKNTTNSDTNKTCSALIDKETPPRNDVFVYWMHMNDPWAHDCIPTRIPGLGLTAQNQFTGAYVENAKFYNMLHENGCEAEAKDQNLTMSTLFTVPSVEEKWKVVGLEEGLPAEWADVERKFGEVGENCKAKEEVTDQHAVSVGERVTMEWCWGVLVVLVAACIGV